MEDDNQLDILQNTGIAAPTAAPDNITDLNISVLEDGSTSGLENVGLPDSPVLSGNTPQDLSFIVDNVRQRTRGFDLPSSKFAQRGMDQTFNSFLSAATEDNRLNY